ncbi:MULTISPECIES: TetR/AcrR family transcriptional regulator [Ramlibacter]|nr:MULTISPECIES: TetR/AcrR family transcriptional regulator [Ramlibacter]
MEAGKVLFLRKGIDTTTIGQIAERAGVSEATVYATVGSKSGLLRALMEQAMFGPRFQEALQALQGVDDPVERIALTARVARAIYEAQAGELGLLTRSSAFSPELRKSQQAFEKLRRDMQRDRIDALFEAGQAREGLDREAAATLMWMYTSQEVFHKLVQESGWSLDAYEQWLAHTLVWTLTRQPAAPK